MVNSRITMDRSEESTREGGGNNLKRKAGEDCQSNELSTSKQLKKIRKGNTGTASYRFKLKGISCFDNTFPYFREPREVGSFSQDYKRQFHADKRQLKYVVTYPKSSVHFNLRNGFKEMIKRDESKMEYIDDLLRWVIKYPSAFSTIPEVKGKDSEQTDCVSKNLKSLNTDFICWRGLLTKLLCTPYENREGWEIGITLYKGTYFLCEFTTEEKKKQEESRTERQEEMCYWGWKFEQYVTSDTEGGKPDTAKPVNNNEAFCSVVRSRLKNNSLVYGGEIDGIDPSIKGSNKYVEFKTTRRIDSRKQDVNFKRFKLLKWWAQSFLVGISKIICGFRDDNGIVHSLQEYSTQHIPDETSELHNAWKPNVCFNFMDEILNFIKEKVTEDNPRLVHLLQYIPGQDITLQLVDTELEPKYLFLPEWFINWDGWEDSKTS